MSLLEQLKKNSTIKESDILKNSKFFNKKDMVQTHVPAINVALSGSLDGGLTPGLTVIAGPSRHFKTSFALLLAKAYQDKYDDAVILFYDSEFGSPQGYFETFGINTERVLHTPITDIEQLKHDIMQQLSVVDRGQRLMVIIDSIGNLASKKEVEDALDGKSVADMTRAKGMKSLFRMVTPHLNLKDIPMVVVNHTYKTMELYSKDVVSGGCVVAGTMVQTKGGFKKVEDIIPGDLVITALGERTVTHSWNPDTLDEGVKECFEIEFEDGFKVTCSDEHKFFIEGGWVDAKNLKIGDDCLSV